MLGKVKALAAGFVVGLLIAPRSGRESRRMVMGWINDLLDGGSRRLQELEDELAARRSGADGGEWSRDETITDDEPLP
jgi:gas vesicle protein